ncbi:MAG: ribonuclease III [Saccharofermentanales bacterium]
MRYETPERLEDYLWLGDDETLEKYFRELECSLRYKFKDRKILLQALTHSTYAYENKNISIRNNERLEFLGDCVLDLIIGDLLYREPDEYSEGVMSKTRALIVCETTLSNIAKEIRLGSFLLLGKGENQNDGRDKNSNLSNALESVLAAVYLDGGFDAAYKLVESLFAEPLQQAQRGAIEHDHKSKLLEYVQGIQQQDSIEFKIVREEGPEHKRTFYAQVNYYNMVVGSGIGSTKKEAEQEAAKEALTHIKSAETTLI